MLDVEHVSLNIMTQKPDWCFKYNSSLMLKYVVIITFISRTTRTLSDVFVHIIGCSVWRRYFVYIIRPI
jgi:hypothetical protein